MALESIGHPPFRFMNDPNVPDELGRAGGHDLDIDLDALTYYIGGQSPDPNEDDPVMAVWRERLFLYMGRNAARPVIFYGLPADQVIELGMQNEL